MSLNDWIKFGRERGASDLLIESGTPLVYRIRGDLQPVGEPLAHEVVQSTAKSMLTGAAWSEFLERKSFDLSKTLAGTRVRIHVFQTSRGLGLALRLLSSFQNTVRDCNLHPDVARFAIPKTGLVLVSGATGSGKSTTMAALIEELNQSVKRHIVTIENPIEYFFQNKKSVIRQREIPTHSPSVEQAIMDSLRENPDVLVIGEMRTPEAMRLTLSAAETGHLVLATLHSATTAEALARICMSFPAEIQGSVRTQLADTLVGVICQRLDYLPHLDLRVPVCEILTANSAVKSVIRAGSWSQLVSALQAGGEDGMYTFDRYQKWKDSKHDWIKPTELAPNLANEAERPVRPELRGTSAKRNVAHTAPESSAESENRIHIDPLEDDLEELVKKIGDE